MLTDLFSVISIPQKDLSPPVQKMCTIPNLPLLGENIIQNVLTFEKNTHFMNIILGTCKYFEQRKAFSR